MCVNVHVGVPFSAFLFNNLCIFLFDFLIFIHFFVFIVFHPTLPLHQAETEKVATLLEELEAAQLRVVEFEALVERQEVEFRPLFK